MLYTWTHYDIFVAGARWYRTHVHGNIRTKIACPKSVTTIFIVPRADSETLPCQKFIEFHFRAWEKSMSSNVELPNMLLLENVPASSAQVGQMIFVRWPVGKEFGFRLVNLQFITGIVEVSKVDDLMDDHCFTASVSKYRAAFSSRLLDATKLVFANKIFTLVERRKSSDKFQFLANYTITNKNDMNSIWEVSIDKRKKDQIW